MHTHTLLPRRAFRPWPLLACLVLLLALTPARARANPVAGAAAAAEASGAATMIPVAAGFVKDLTAIPLAVADVLKLPMGVAECVLAPLPGVEFMSGLRHIGTGIIAPFRLCIAVLSLPADAVNAVSGAGKVVTGKQ